MLRLMLSLLALAAWCGHFSVALDAQQPGGLEAELLEGLDADLLDDLPPLIEPEEESADRLPPDDPARRGSDIGPPAEAAGDDPPAQIALRMRDVQQRLDRRSLEEDTRQMQRQIVDDLDQLLKLLQQQRRQQRQASGSGQPPPSQRTEVSENSGQPQPGQPQPTPGGSEAADDSTPGVRDAEEEGRIDPAELDDLMKEVWGHLPETAREQLRQSSVERFLPKYELLIERIYRRMAEQREERP